MKKNSKKVVLQKPKTGEYYRIFDDRGLDLFNVIKIVKVNRNIAYYVNLGNDNSMLSNRWDYVNFPEILSQVLSPLEVELL